MVTIRDIGADMPPGVAPAGEAFNEALGDAIDAAKRGVMDSGRDALVIRRGEALAIIQFDASESWPRVIPIARVPRG